MKLKRITNIIILLTLILFLNACVITMPLMDSQIDIPIINSPTSSSNTLPTSSTLVNSPLISSSSNPSVFDDFEWKNENAVYAVLLIESSINYFNTFVSNINNYFKPLNYQRLYIAGKSTDSITNLHFVKVLFILNEGGDVKQQEFINELLLDNKVYSTQKCYDVPYKTIDTRHLDTTSATIYINRSLDIYCLGYLDVYYPSFDFSCVLVNLADYNQNKTYTTNDFSKLNLLSVTKSDFKNYLCLNFTDSNYFNFIKSCDIIAREANITTRNVDSKFHTESPPIWEVLDETIINILGRNYESYVTIVGLRKGTTTINYGHLSCEVTVL